MFDLAREYIIDRFPNVPPSSARVAFDKFQELGLVETPLWGEYDFQSGKIWSQQLQPSVHRYFHSWNFMSSWITLSAHDDNILRIISGIATRWISEFASLKTSDPRYSFVYHDEGTAQRVRNAIRLHYILENSSDAVLETTRKLEKLLVHSGELLETQDFYSGLNNHGMFQSLALRDLAAYAGWIAEEARWRFLDIANKRLLDYFDVAYTSEGVHIEHSPTYHLMVARDMAEHVQFLKTIGGSGTEHLQSILNNATRHSTHAILPNGVFFPFSDTQQLPLANAANNVTDSETFKYAATAGSEGIQPESRTLCEPESGFFIHRSAWGESDSRFLAFTAAYNADYHKHSDDLHVYLWDNGHELLSESGPYGYGAEDPFVRYGFSQWAHNNIVIDNKSLPRTDGKYSKVGIHEIFEDAGIWTVDASNARHDDVVHQRSIKVDDSISHLYVKDVLCANEDHKYTLNWNFGPAVHTTIENNTVIGRIEGIIAFILTVESEEDVEVEHYRGRGGEQPLGWKFPKMNTRTPASLVSFSVTGSNVSIETSVAVLRPAGFGKDNMIFPPYPIPRKAPSGALAASRLGPIEYVVSKGSITVDSVDRKVERAVIKLFSQQGEHSVLSGRVESIRWDSLKTGSYRLRIYPKHESLKYEPYTTEWFHV